MDIDKTEIKVAIIDLYADYPNQGMRNFKELCERYKQKHQVNLTYEVFDLRGKNEVPSVDFDVYLSSGGPGSPIDSEGSEWEHLYWELIEAIDTHNKSDSPNKKHVLFVCHSFQLMCRKFKLGLVTQRHSESFGILPMHQTDEASSEVLFEGLADPFFAVDSREWQVINPDKEKFAAMGATLLAIEKERPHIHLPRAMMAIRFNDYFFGTQFHPEADPVGMKKHMLDAKRKTTMIAEYGEKKYYDMLAGLDDPDKIMLTQNTIIPNFLYQALHTLQPA